MAAGSSTSSFQEVLWLFLSVKFILRTTALQILKFGSLETTFRDSMPWSICPPSTFALVP
jgi:hypothetical protein